MSLFPVIVIFGLSFPPIFFELLLSLAIFWLVQLTAGSDRHLRFCLAPSTVLIRRSIAAFLFDIALVRLRLM